MITLIAGADLYAPEPRGTTDLLVAGGRVAALGAGAAVQGDAVETVDGRGKLLLPGLVDALTHPCGGGGEGGFANRTAEIPAADFIRAGVTAPVGALGTDSIGRSLEVLYGSVMALRGHGLRAFMLSGAYRVPAPTLTGDIARDLVLIDPVVGIGEVAVAEHRGTQPTAQELRRLAAETRLGGTLKGCGGTVLVHVGEGAERLALLREAIAGSDLPPGVLYPTHVNRSHALLAEAAAWTREGGFVDITVSTTPELIAAGDITALDALAALREGDADLSRISFSSDAGGSLPLYRDGELVGLQAAAPSALNDLLAETLQKAPDQLPAVIAGLTANPAAALRLPGVGRLLAGGPADLLLADAQSGRVTDVMAKGRWLMRDGELVNG